MSQTVPPTKQLFNITINLKDYDWAYYRKYYTHNILWHQIIESFSGVLLTKWQGQKLLSTAIKYVYCPEEDTDE